VRAVGLLGVDIALLLAATLCSLYLRENFQVSAQRLTDALPYFAATFTAGIIVFPLAGLNRPMWRFAGLQDHLRVGVAVACAAAIASILTFSYNRLDGIARSLPILQTLTSLLLLSGVRTLHRLSHERSYHRKAQAKLLTPLIEEEVAETVLVVGVSRLAETYLQAAAEMAPGRVRIAGLAGGSDRHAGRLVASQPVLGAPEQLQAILDTLEVHGIIVDRIVVAIPFQALTLAARDALLLAESARGITLSFLAKDLNLDFAASNARGKSARREGAGCNQHFEIAPASLEAIAQRRYWAAKRAIDVAGALVLLLILAPPMIAIAIIVAANLGTPVIFWQQRPGLGGRAFRLYKFRTMRSAHDYDGRALSDGERVSGIGAALRRLRLDELPQLFNILRGDMSFIGPRPLLSRDQSEAFAARLLVRPGLTGWAQVVGGREISPLEKAALDVWYVCNASLALDLKIAWRTVPMVLFGERICFAHVEHAFADLSASGIMQTGAVLRYEKLAS
jgi:lipopolysaccharide/colanic/teichoic acid biosynthesis glycosyltransferase